MATAIEIKEMIGDSSFRREHARAELAKTVALRDREASYSKDLQDIILLAEYDEHIAKLREALA